MAITTTTQIAGPVNVVFQTELLRNAKANCPYFYGSAAAEISENRGTFSAKWRRIENLTPTTTPLTELTGAVALPTRTGTQPTVTDVTATAQKFGDFMFLNEEVDLINFNGQAEKLSEVLGIQAGRSLNRLQRDVLEDNLTAIFSGTATTATGLAGGSTASGFWKPGDADAAVNILDRNDASKFKPMTNGSQNIGTLPIRSAFCGFCHPDVAAGLRALTGFIEAQQYAGQTELFPDEVGFLRGIRFIETSEATIDFTTGVAATGSATVHGRSTATRYDVYSTPVIGKDCVGSLGLDTAHVKEVYMAGDRLPAVMMISHAKGSAGVGDPLNELSSMGWKSWHAGVVLNSAWGRVVKTVAPILDSNE